MQVIFGLKYLPNKQCDPYFFRACFIIIIIIIIINFN